VTISHLVKRMKGASSAVAAQAGLGGQGRLYWAKGYAVHTVSVSALGWVRAYLRSQPRRHTQEAISGWDGDRPEYDRAG
jgi:REP element-mobilizing transposase RayT